jgi:lipoprotein-anchoring transpeptidase ErfK/SrfK
MSHADTTVFSYRCSRWSRRAPRLLATIIALLAGLLLAACGRAQPDSATGADAAAVTAVAAPAQPRTGAGEDATPDAAARDGSDDALVARATAALDVFAAPGDREATRTLPATTTFGTPTVVLVSQVGAGADEGWLQVLLPVRPNGSTGWVRADDVVTRTVSLTVEVDRDRRTLSVRDGDRRLLTTDAAVGDPDHPTPAGQFYVVDKLRTPAPDGAYGPFALGLSARSDVLTEFAGGDGQVGIHGTNDPSSIGRAVSHGCVRVDNGAIAQLAELLPLGTPVTII